MLLNVTQQNTPSMRKKEATWRARGEWQMKLYKKRMSCVATFIYVLLLPLSRKHQLWCLTMYDDFDDLIYQWFKPSVCLGVIILQYYEFRGIVVDCFPVHTQMYFEYKRRQTKEINMFWPLENSNTNFHSSFFSFLIMSECESKWLVYCRFFQFFFAERLLIYFSASQWMQLYTHNNYCNCNFVVGFCHFIQRSKC